MKKQTRFHFLLPVLLILLLLVSLPVSAEETSGTLSTGQTWNFDSATGTLTVSGTGELPDYPYSSSLTSQAPWKVWRENIKSIVLSEGITDTGNCTFHQLTNLTKVQLPSTLKTIGDNAFSDAAALKEVTIPSSVTTIGMSAFKGCNALADITLPEGVKTIGNRAFNSCASLVSITIPASVELIDNYAFQNCPKLQVATIMGAPKIGDAVIGSSKLIRFCGNPPSFTTNSLSGVDAECYYPKSNTLWATIVTKSYGGTVDWFASDDPAHAELHKFDDTKSGTCGPNATWSLTSGILTVSGNGKIDTVGWKRYTAEIQKVVIQDGITHLPGSPFMNCVNLKNVSLPDSLIDLGANAFSGCTNLPNITLPTGITTIPWYTFRDCTSLKVIILPNGIISIGEYAFFRAGLETITLSNTLTKIEHAAFSGCTKLEEIHFPASLETLGEGSFSNCTSLRKIYFAGDPPKVSNSTFSNVEAIAYYPTGNKLWENGGMAYHGGRIEDRPDSEQHLCIDHTYGDWVVTVEPTPDVDWGIQERVCTVCGYKQIAGIPVDENAPMIPDTSDPATTAPPTTTPPVTVPSTQPATESNTPPTTESTSTPATEPDTSQTTQPNASQPATSTPAPADSAPSSAAGDAEKNDPTILIVCIVLGVALIGGGAAWYFLHKRK